MMTISETIHTALAVTKTTGVKALVLSGPGFGKTTHVNSYGAKYGYHVETLVGSRLTPATLCGAMVNEPGKESLIYKNPSWYQRILEKEAQGIPSILFLDEIGTCNAEIQGAMLTLACDGNLGEERFLPKSTLVIAAANYSGNVNGLFTILAPMLNRFAIINLMEGMGIRDFFANWKNHRAGTEVIPEFNFKAYDKEAAKAIEDDFVAKFETVCVDYFESNKLNFLNQDYSGLYDDQALVYNIMSLRTAENLAEVIAAMILTGANRDFYKTMINGLLGMCVGTFRSLDQQRTWVDLIMSVALKVAAAAKSNTVISKDKGKDIYETLNAVLLTRDTGTKADMKAVKAEVVEKMGQISTEEFVDKNVAASFVNTFDTLLEVYHMYKGTEEESWILEVLVNNASRYCDYTNNEKLKNKLIKEIGYKFGRLTTAGKVVYEVANATGTLLYQGDKGAPKPTEVVTYKIA